MAHPTAVILVVGLNTALLEAAPRLSAFAGRRRVRRLRPVLPAVTCSVQASMLTGLPVGGPRGHGIVGNGWYHRELAEAHFWKQSNRLVHGEKVWETARRRDPSVTCANLFWWFNMYSSAEYSVTPRPQYKADGRKIPDIYTEPQDLRPWLQERFGTFPLFRFWGPGASIESSRWIADAAMAVHERHAPTLTLVYLPHLDYALQRFGPDDARSLVAIAEIDAQFGRLLDYFDAAGVRVVVVSEYGIEAVEEAVHVNRALREAGALRVREEGGGELLDPGASDAFAVADHQVAHVYVKDPAQAERFAALCRELPGVERVLDRSVQEAERIDHERSGDLLLIAGSGRWFSYQYWLDEARAPDFARTVDIHRKPGYDPLELLIDPAIRAPGVKIAGKLLKKAVGLRYLMDVVPLDTRLVRGSHGRVEQPPDQQPVMITRADAGGAGGPGGAGGAGEADPLPCERVRDVVLAEMFDG